MQVAQGDSHLIQVTGWVEAVDEVEVVDWVPVTEVAGSCATHPVAQLRQVFSSRHDLHPSLHSLLQTSLAR